MELEARHLGKVDDQLRRALEQASGDEVLRGVVQLVAAPQPDGGPRPEAFATREAYRQALIRHRRKHLEAGLRGVLARLADLSLHPRGGGLSQTAVVEGPARQFRAALELPEVRHASLDQPLTPALLPRQE